MLLPVEVAFLQKSIWVNLPNHHATDYSYVRGNPTGLFQQVKAAALHR